MRASFAALIPLACATTVLAQQPLAPVQPAPPLLWEDAAGNMFYGRPGSKTVSAMTAEERAKFFRSLKKDSKDPPPIGDFPPYGARESRPYIGPADLRN